MNFALSEIFLWTVGVYLLFGFIFAVPFVLVGAAKIDPHAAESTWGFRLLIFPGAWLLWLLLASRWWQAKGSPPEERTAHRVAVASRNV